MILDVNESLFANYGIDYIESLDSNITSLILPNWSCNDVNYTIFDISRFTLLESLEIGDDSFESIESFMINDLPKLRNLKIGSNSFTKLKFSEWIMNKLRGITSDATSITSKLCFVLNCESLESIDIGEFSFFDFGGDFALYNMISLKSIKIGEIENESCNFAWSSFIIEGITYIYYNDQIDLPSLQSIELGNSSFAFSSTTIIESMILI